MSRKYGIRRPDYAVFVLYISIFVAVDATAGDCDDISKLRAEATTDFQSIRIPSSDKYSVPSLFQLPGTDLCEIRTDSTEYRCEWYLGSSATPQGEADAKSALESLLSTVQPCLAPAQDIERRPRSGGGEVIYLTDEVVQDAPQVHRRIELSYIKYGRYWILRFVYWYWKHES